MDIQLKNLAVGYSGNTVLTDINVGLSSGDMVMLIGKNGSGKSTLLKSIAGILPVLSGDIIVNGVSLSGIKNKERSKLIGIVLTRQTGINMRVYEFIRLGRQSYTSRLDFLSNHDKQVIDKYIDKLHLRKFVQRHLMELSDGERQKVFLARALVQETPVLLLDEPATHLDLENKALLFQLLLDIKEKENKIILFSSHDINLLIGKIKKIWMTINGTLNIYNYSQLSEIQKAFQSGLLYYDDNCKQFKF
jgi:iron complex transport system ATP-binding protein